MDLQKWLKNSIRRGFLSLLPVALLASLADAALLYGVKAFVGILSGTASFSLWLWALVMLGIMLVRFGLLLWRGNWTERFLRRLEAGLRAWFARRLRNIHPRYFHDPESDGRLQAAYDAVHVLPVSGEALMQALQAVLQILIFFPVLFYLSIPLTLVLLFVIIPVIAYVQRRLHSMGPEVDRQMVREGAFRSELESSKKLFRSWSGAAERSALSRSLLSHVRELLEIGLRVGRRKVMLSQSMETLSLFSMVAVLTFCGWMIARHWMDPAGLILYCSALFLCYKPVKECARLMPQLRTAKSAWDLLLALSLYPCRRERRYLPGESLSLERVTFGYRGMEHPVFESRDERFIPVAGRHLLICGPNGSGKSSLLRLIANLEEPEAGRVRIPASLLAGGVFLVSQEVFLPPLEWLRREMESFRKREARGLPEVERFVEQAGVGRLLFKEGYSGGEKARLALAWALISPARLVLLDEPFAFIARRDRTPLLSAFLDAADAGGKWILMASHEEMDPAVLSRFTRFEVSP